MSKLSIDLKVPTGTDYYGAAATDVEARAGADYIMGGLRRYCREHYPAAEVSYELVPETLSEGNHTRVETENEDGYTDIDDDAEQALHDEQQRLFAEWCEVWAGTAAES